MWLAQDGLQCQENLQLEVTNFYRHFPQSLKKRHPELVVPHVIKYYIQLDRLACHWYSSIPLVCTSYYELKPVGDNIKLQHVYITYYVTCPVFEFDNLSTPFMFPDTFLLRHSISVLVIKSPST